MPSSCEPCCARQGDHRAEDDVDRLEQSPTPHRLYDAACAMALLQAASPDPRIAQRSLRLLARALDMGIPHSQAAADPDLKALHAEPAFQTLVPRATATLSTPETTPDPD